VQISGSRSSRGWQKETEDKQGSTQYTFKKKNRINCQYGQISWEEWQTFGHGEESETMPSSSGFGISMGEHMMASESESRNFGGDRVYIWFCENKTEIVKNSCATARLHRGWPYSFPLFPIQMKGYLSSMIADDPPRSRPQFSSETAARWQALNPGQRQSYGDGIPRMIEPQEKERETVRLNPVRLNEWQPNLQMEM
jgi:hypothetical protein